MLQATVCELLLYVDDTCLIFQHKDITEIETTLNKNFSPLCDWFYFGEDKTKSISFDSKHKIKNPKALNTQYSDIKVKHYSKVTYLVASLMKFSQENPWPFML